MWHGPGSAPWLHRDPPSPVWTHAPTPTRGPSALPRPSRSHHLAWSPGAYGHTRPARLRHTNTDTPSSAGWLSDNGPRRPALGRCTHLAPTATWPQGRPLLSALFTGAYRVPRMGLGHSRRSTHACGRPRLRHTRTRVPSPASAPYSSPMTPWTTRSGSPKEALQPGRLPENLPGIAEPQGSGTQSPHWNLYSFPGAATGRGAWHRVFFLHGSGAQTSRIQLRQGCAPSRGSGEGPPFLVQLLGASGLVAASPQSLPPTSHGHFLSLCVPPLFLRALVTLLHYGLILTASHLQRPYFQARSPF